MPTATVKRKRRQGASASIFKARGISSAKDLSNRTGLSYWVANGAMNGDFSPSTRDRIATVLGLPPQELGTPTLGEKPGRKVAYSAGIPPAVSAVKRESVSGIENNTATSPIQPSLTESQKELLLDSLFQSRKANGFTRSEAEQVITHFEQANSRFIEIQIEQAAIADVFNGKRFVNVEDGKVVISEGGGPSIASIAQGNAIHLLVEQYVVDGKKSGWKEYYAKEKRNGVRYWIKALSLSNVTDITAAKFDRAIRGLFAAKKSKGTIEKYSQSLVAFSDWAFGRGYLPVNPIAGKSAASYLETLRK